MLTFFRFLYTVDIPGTNYVLSATAEYHWTEFHFPQKKKPQNTSVLYRKRSQILPSLVPDQLSAQILDLTEKKPCNPEYETKNLNTRGARPKEVKSRDTWISGYSALKPKLPFFFDQAEIYRVQSTERVISNWGVMNAHSAWHLDVHFTVCPWMKSCSLPISWNFAHLHQGAGMNTTQLPKERGMTIL